MSKEIGYVKDWRDCWDEIELLGQRLDAARQALARSREDTWAYGRWKTIVDVLTKKWRLMTAMHAAGLRQVSTDETPINYNWFESTDEHIGGIRFAAVDDFFERKRVQDGLVRSWDAAHEQKR